MATYMVTIKRLGRVERKEVWAYGVQDARRKALAAFPGADVLAAERRKAL